MSKANNKTYVTGELESVQDSNNLDVRTKEEQRKQLGQVFKEQPKFDVSGAPMYQAYFGKQMAIIINGIAIYVPLDGKHYLIPESFAEVFNSRLTSINEDLELQKKFSDVRSNLESYPGELDLVQPV